jgi:hypothetical protein
MDLGVHYFQTKPHERIHSPEASWRIPGKMMELSSCVSSCRLINGKILEHPMKTGRRTPDGIYLMNILFISNQITKKNMFKMLNHEQFTKLNS